MNKIAVILTLFLVTSAFAQNSKNTTNQNQKAQKNSSSSEPSFPKVPPLKKGEYAVFFTDKYITFTTRTFETLELDSNCFKNNKPQCEAYAMAKATPKEIESLNGATNIAAVNCELMNGRNLIAFDFQKNEHNFCRYRDGSLVNSWSMYQLHNPVKMVK